MRYYAKMKGNETYLKNRLDQNTNVNNIYQIENQRKE
jgi:hypothetical protein